MRLSRARRMRKVLRYPVMDALDEYPAVPYLIADGTGFQFDSSAIADWLDAHYDSGALPFVPESPVLAFVARLVDEAFDEYGLYMVHHQRWVSSAQSTTMGEVTAAELARLISAPLAAFLRVNLPRRQVRRCPYLFSVAPPGYLAAVEPQRVAPSRPGFPATHALLEQSWLAYVDALESLLSVQPFILGGRFTLADASAYGQLSMNLIDPATRSELQQRAPVTHQWLLDIRDGKHHGSSGELSLSPALLPLLKIIMTTFAPLMVQNERAYQRSVTAGETVFNEAAFDRDLALYNGELLGHCFRAVVKTFQVRVWGDLRMQWQALDESQRAALAAVLPNSHLLDSAD